VPLALAGVGIERKHAVGEKVLSLAEPAVEVFRRGAGGCEDPAALLVDGDAAPGVGAAEALALRPRPRVVSELPGLRDGVEDPAQPPRDRIEGPDVPR
jgi:hypothetical protein